MGAYLASAGSDAVSAEAPVTVLAPMACNTRQLCGTSIIETNAVASCAICNVKAHAAAESPRLYAIVHDHSALGIVCSKVGNLAPDASKVHHMTVTQK